ncbi:MAG: glycosyltransferase, partial [Eubacteriales bacterium]
MKQDTNKPHILIYAHYYHPDVASTGQILKELAEGLLEQFRVTVLCVVPSYKGTVDEAYTKQKYYYEELNGVRIIRVRVPPFDKTSRSSRVKNIVAYFFRAMWATLKVPDVDYVYSISQPPVLGGLLGCYGRIFRHARYIYNIQDFNPEQIIATGYSKSKLLLKVLSVLDKHSCKCADKVIIVGRDMVETLEKRFTKKNGKRSRKMPTYAFINNWIDEKEIYPLPLSHPRVDDFRKANGLSDKYVIMYSGNLGLYYDLENILPKLAKFPKGTKTADGREV